MELLHSRYDAGPHSTISKISDEAGYICYLLEDKMRDEKIHGETAIPAGRYLVTLRTEGGKHADYGRRFPGFHRGMIWIRDIPGYEYVYYHIGNTVKDSLGCPLTGLRAVKNDAGDYETRQSTDAYKILAQRCHDAWDRGEEVWTTITDHKMVL